MKPVSTVVCIAAAIALSACTRPADNRLGMVTDDETGLMYGSAIQDNLVTDASFYSNRKIKVRSRNTSGDPAFGLDAFTGDLNTAYAQKGYEPTTADDFGLMMDINVIYSGQAQTTRVGGFSLIGALLGMSYGGQTQRGLVTGTVIGAELGDIIGRYDTQDTYMVVANVTFAVMKPYRQSRRRVTFSRSEKIDDLDDPNEDDTVIMRSIKKSYSTQIAVYAGGRNVAQSDIAEHVRQRTMRIVADFI